MCVRLGLARIALTAVCAVATGLWLVVAPAGAVSLPDGRVYEAVSPVDSEGSANIYVPTAGARYTDTNSYFGGIITRNPFVVAPSGEAVVYPGDPPPTGGGSGGMGEGNGDQYLAVRSSGGGWTQVDLQPTGQPSRYQAFSSDLSVGFLRSTIPLAAGAPADCKVLFSRTTGDGVYHAVFTTTQIPGECGEPEFAGSSADSSHLLFASSAALIPGAVAEQSNLYESVDGRLGLVNVLPNGGVVGKTGFGFDGHNIAQSRVISADGSRVFWTDNNTEVTAENPLGVTRLFVRENGSRTVQLDASQGPGSSGGGRFLDQSSDGSKVLFTDCSRLTADSTAVSGLNGCVQEGEEEAELGPTFTGNDLYEYDLNSGRLTDLSVDGNAGDTLGADVQGLVGESEDGSYVYFVAHGVLASNENGEGEKAETGKDNLYLRHNASTSFIATLSVQDGNEVFPFSGESNENSGDWRASIGKRTAEVTPDGQELIFMSNRSLTGYDNVDGGTSLDEVFLYEAGGAGVLRCVSCNPSGEPPVPTEFDVQREGHVGAFFPISKAPVPGDIHQTRGIVDDGSRVFFDSAEPLVRQDINGWIDVYEWERDGAGGCRQDGGCVYLLSGGTSPESSWLLGADASGDNVFILTRAQLLVRDRNENVDVYDARVGGVKQSAPPACSGSGCQGVAPAPPVFSTPSSVTFNGVGNFASSSTKPVMKPRTRSKTVKCKKGRVKRKGRCVKRSKAGGAKKSAKGRK